MVNDATTRAILQLIEDLWEEIDQHAATIPMVESPIQVRAYGALYEEPVKKIAAFVFRETGLCDKLQEAASSSDPNAAIVELARSAEPSRLVEGESARILAIAWLVLLVNLDSIRTFGYSMPELIEQVANGDDQALFRAVYLDASALQAQSIANRVSGASLSDDRTFFDSLSKALTRTKPSRPKPHLDGVRVLMNILSDAGELDRLSDSDLTDFVVNKIGLLQTSRDPFSAIRAQRRKREREGRGPKR